MRKIFILSVLALVLLIAVPTAVLADADIDDNGVIDLSDLILVTNFFGKTSGYDSEADTDTNGIIDIYDVVYVASRVGTTMPEENIVYANSCNLADVKAAIDSANYGDIVQLPEGTCDWDNELLTYKEVHVRGAGRDKTIIRRSPSSPSHYVFIYDAERVDGQPETIARFKFSGIKLVDPRGPYGDYNSSQITAGLTLRYGAKDFLVYDSEFQGFSDAGVFVRDYERDHVLIPDGRSWGVIYNNRFIDCYMGGLGYGVSVYGSQDKDWDIHPLDLGGSHAVFIEDNYFSGERHTVASGSGSRYVFRYNTIENNRRSHMIDAHGWTGDETYSNRGSRQYEIYGNTLIGNNVHYPDGIGIRGGDGVIFNNVMRNYVAYPIFLTHDNMYLCCTNDSYPCHDQITELHMWNNTEDGVLINSVGQTGNAQVALFGTCITDILQEGRDFFFTPRPNYTPYPYPHPLRSS